MNWHPLTSSQQLDHISERSSQVPVLIFKHSTRCSISFMAKHRLESDWNFNDEEIEPYYLDLIAHRNISGEIAERFAVHHESPQILLIKDGECVLDASHLDITVEEIKEMIDGVEQA
jgi:bacillithiol system protein YtxJ